MDLTDRRRIQQLLKKYGVAPRRHWGQNFLASGATLAKVLRAASVEPHETILEIGGGLGALTVELAQRAKRVIVYERDAGLCAALADILVPYPNVELRCKDARKIPTSHLPSTNYRLIANLPYGVGTAILRELLENERAPRECLVILQREVAERIAAKPPNNRLISIAFQAQAEPKILARIRQRSAFPAPDVESALLRLTLRSPLSPKENRGALTRVLKSGFAHPRKLLFRNLESVASRQTLQAAFAACRVLETARPQELAVAQWRCLAQRMMIE